MGEHIFKNNCVGIIGLGLIGGSIAKAYYERACTKLVIVDKGRALLSQRNNTFLLKNNLTDNYNRVKECDIIFIALPYGAAREVLDKIAPVIGNNTLVIDCVGVKKDICEQGFRLADKYGFTFVGGHPMAGSHFSGFNASRGSLFKNASFLAVFPISRENDEELKERVELALEPMEFGRILYTTAEKHDEMIAYTSQLPHILSNAYVQNELQKKHHGFSSGSYKDFTRVAYLNVDMWVELFKANKKELLKSIDDIQQRLSLFYDFIANDKEAELRALLQNGVDRKNNIDKIEEKAIEQGLLYREDRSILSENSENRLSEDTRIINVNSSTHSYPIYLSREMEKNLSYALKAIKPSKVLVLTDAIVEPIYKGKVISTLNSLGIENISFTIIPGESSKNWSNLGLILRDLSEADMNRADAIITLGGGVVGDLGALAASLFMRGIKLIAIPTTLLSMVDSSVGGKTAVDLPMGKNLVGTFYPPHAVIISSNSLYTLPRNELQNGMAEVIKEAFIGSPRLLSVLDNTDGINALLDEEKSENLIDIIELSIMVKKVLIERDEFDNGDRQLLNLGHTLAHAIEALSSYSIPHGEAVAMGMAVIYRASYKNNQCPKSELLHLLTLLLRFELSLTVPKHMTDIDALFNIIRSDKKRRGNKISLVVPNEKGKIVLQKMLLDDARNYLSAGINPIDDSETVYRIWRGGKIKSLSSKSHLHRILLLSALSDNSEIFIETTLKSADILSTIRAIEAIGAKCRIENDGIYIIPIKASLNISKLSDVRNIINEPTIDCGESGSTYRFILPVLVFLGFNKANIILHNRLGQRPIDSLRNSLIELSAEFSSIKKNGDKYELQIKAYSCPNIIRELRELELDISQSSQYVTGLLLAMASEDRQLSLRLLGKPVSKGYIDLTVNCLKLFGKSVKWQDNIIELGSEPLFVKKEKISIQGDYSNSAPFLIMSAMLNDLSMPITVTGLDINSEQGDKAIIDILEMAGCDVEVNKDSITVYGAKEINGIDIKCDNIPDLVPYIAVLACASKERSYLREVDRLRIKESDRIESTIALIRGLGGNIYYENNCLIIDGFGYLRGGVIYSYNDHRITMAAAIAANICHRAVKIIGKSSINKSYPDFFEIIEKL